MRALDAVVVGSGPNGLAAALTLAEAGLQVGVYEGAEHVGGGCATEELTLPGFAHDVCSAVHPLLAASPFFSGRDPSRFGVELLRPRVAFAHPLDGGRAAAVVTSLADTAADLGMDGPAYLKLFAPLVRDAPELCARLLAPLRTVPTPLGAMARFALAGTGSAQGLAARFSTEEARALLAGASAHAMRPLDAPLSAGFGVLLTMLAHVVGWPVARGGSGRIADALTVELERHGAIIHTRHPIRRLTELPAARAVLLDVAPRQFVTLAGDALTARSRRALQRFAYGPGVCKVDWALAGPVPWRAEVCRDAGTLHLGGAFEEVARAEADVARGRHPESPYVIISQPSVVDPTRAPGSAHTLWGYCHVPTGSTVDMTERIESQIERFAPGFRELVLGRSTRTAADLEAHNPNYVGGDINGGAATARQMLLGPTPRWNPYRTALAGVYLCSASTPPGGGVHGMCGVGAARAALRDLGVDAASR